MAVQTFEPQGRTDALLAAVLRKTLQGLLKPVFAPRWSIAFQRRWLHVLSRLTLVPSGLRITPAIAGGVAGEWVRPAEGTARRGTLLYLHGGAYCVGSPATHRAISGRLARATGMAVFVPDYRLAPEHRFPAAVNDAVAACRALQTAGASGASGAAGAAGASGTAGADGADGQGGRDEAAGAGTPVVVAGDSAGGGLAVAAALALRDGGHAGPAALLLFSPWVDMTLAWLPAAPPAGEAMLSAEWASACAAHCLGGADASHPWASPLRADLRGLPPTLIQAGTDELLHGDALRLHDALQAAGVAVRCEISARRWHVFQMHAGLLRSADEALQRAADFVGRTVDAVAPAATEAEQEVVILGAGMSGLCMAIQLKQAGLHDFVVLEKSDGLGGTWWDNRYPGAHVDVPAPLYSFSFAPHAHWRRRFAAAPEIQAYMEHCARHFGVRPHLRFSTQITDARFDEAAGRWRITTARGQTLLARFFVCSTGPLSQARWPDIPGLETFRGRRLHSARWDRDFDARGQRVAVIGTGSTASQLVPPLAAAAARLHVFQRTANWVLPRPDRRYFAPDRWLAHLPPYSKLVRAFWYAALEWGRRGFDEGTLARRGMLKTAERHLRHQVRDPALRDRLRPPYPLGCKRIIYSSDYYPALAQPNSELVTAAIERITEHGIVTADGRERPLDALVCATGFDTVHLLSSLRISGLHGRTLAEAWQDGPEAYRGVTVAGFPNLFLMLGPNTATGHTSTLLFVEPEVRYAIACMQAVRASGRRWIAVREPVMREHNAALQARLRGSVWSQCRSWYRMDGGRIVALWPGFTGEYVAGLARPRLEEFEFG